MTDTITIYHNPRCSKSRATLQLLESNGVAPVVVEYLKTPPDSDTLDKLLDLLGLEPRELMRRGEEEYAQADLDNPELSREQLVAAMINTPKLIERPIVVKGDKAVIGRPPENVLTLL